MKRWIPAALALAGGCAWVGRATGLAVPAGPHAYACAASAASGLGYSLRDQKTSEKGVRSFRGEKNVGGYGSSATMAILSVTVRPAKHGRETMQVGGRVERPHTPESRRSRGSGPTGWIGPRGGVGGLVPAVSGGRHDYDYAEDIVLSDGWEIRRACGAGGDGYSDD
jgi:hypothetical protein